MACALATDYHETGHTLQPVRERGGAAYLAKYDTGRLAAALGNTPEADGDGVRWAGRGKVQLTGHRNYQHADERLHALGVLGPGESLLETPDLALRMDVAAACLVFGMAEGWFTGKSFNHYLPGRATAEQFAHARRIINGVDRAELVAGYAVAFQAALDLGGWT
jgi:putative chitinase